jgi:hypothetical protein
MTVKPVGMAIYGNIRPLSIKWDGRVFEVEKIFDINDHTIHPVSYFR